MTGIMLLERLRWLLPALVILWTNPQLGATLPVHDERAHVPANIFDPSAATSTMTRQGYNKRAHPTDNSKNNTQSSHKLVASPAGLLRPDKFQFYTYNDKGDMITRQMTVQEIQGLIAAGGADHVAMDRQEPQKAGDVLTGGKKVMDVVQKVQNVLKSALDKPPALTGTIPKIPEHANVEWSNILPSILSGETDAISPGGDFNQLSQKPATEKDTAPSIGMGATSKVPTKKPVSVPSHVQTNVYGGFANNNAQHEKKPTEKPMIPVPVITLTEQKLSTLQSAVTESPIFQMLSVIPVEATEGGKTDYKEQTTSSQQTSVSSDVPASSAAITTEHGQTAEHFVEVTLTEVPAATTLSQSVSSDTQPVNTRDNVTKTTTSLSNKVDQQEMTVYYSMTMPSVSSTKSTHVDTVTFGASSEATSVTDEISSSSASYVLVMRNENNTKPAYDDSSFAPAVTTESQVSATYDRVIPQTNTTATSVLPLSHASTPLKSDQASNETSPVSSASGVEVPAAPTSLPQQHAADHPPGEGFTNVTKESLGSVTPTYAAHRDSQPTEIQSQPSAPVEPLPTQLIDSLSSVMSQVSEVRPPVLSLPSNETPEMTPIVNIDYEHRVRNDSDQTAIANTQHDASHDTNEEHVVSTETYTTAEALLPVVTVRPADSTVQQSVAMTANRESIANIGVSETPSTAGIATTTTTTTVIPTTTIESMSNDTAIDNSATIPGEVSAESTIQPEETPNNVSSSESQTKATPGADSEKHAVDEATSSVKISSTASTALDVAETQSTTVPSDKSPSEPTSASEIFDDTFAKLNLSDPVAAVDQILNIAPLPSTAPSVEPIALPTHASSLVASDLASGLIAGFATSTSATSSVEGINENQVATNASYVSTIRPTTSSDATKHAEGIGSTTQVYKENVEPEKNDEQKESNVTYAQTTQVSLLTSSVMSDTLKTKESDNNNTTEAIELSSNSERIDDSTKASSPADTVANITEGNVGQSTILAEVVTASPAKPASSDIQSLNATPTAESNDREKTENKEKTKTTEATVVKTNASPESRLPVKVALIDPADANGTGHSVNVTKKGAESGAKTENQTSGESLASISSTTERAAPHSANNSNSKLHGLHKIISGTSNVTLVENSTDSSSQDLNPSVAEIDLRDNSNRTAVQSNKNNYDSSLPSSSYDVSVAEPIAEIDAPELSSDASDSKENLSQLGSNSNTNNSNSVANTTNQSKKTTSSQNTTQSTTTIGENVSGSSMRNGSINEQSNKTESKPASLKHSENPASRPEGAPSAPPPIHQVSKPTIGNTPAEKSDVVSTTEMNTENKWTLITQQQIPPSVSRPKPPRPPLKPSRKPPTSQMSTTPGTENVNVRTPATEATQLQNQQQDTSTQSVLPLDASQSASGLDVTVSHTSADIVNFAKLCNELAFNFWVATNKGLSTARSLALSPFGMTSLLAMIFLGARGPTSDQMNEVLGLDDVATFNPHLVFQNITDTVSLARDQGIANAAFVRELFADKMKVRKLMPFYKEQAQQFYEGLVTEVNFATISDLVRRRTNLLIRKQTGGRIKDFVRTSTVPLRSPLAALSANVFQTDCNSSLTSSVGRDGELYFAVSPAIRQRKLVPVPATTWRSGVLAGYEPSIDATAIALGGSDKLVSTIFVLPGQQGHSAPGDTLDRLEQRLVRSAFRDGAWNKLLKVLIPRNSLELQVPKFSHRSVINATAALKRMGLDELFSGNADFKGINGIGHRLHLADVLQMNLFSTCGDENILNGRHHVETYPATPLRRNVKRHMEVIDAENASVYSDVSPGENRANEWREEDFYREERQASGGVSAEKPKLKLDRPFLYFVRHNPSGIILHMGRFNPRLLS